MSKPRIELRRAHARRSPEARALAESTDQLNRLFIKAEAKLAALRLGVNAWVEGERVSGPDEEQFGWNLGFIKHGDEWGLYVSRWHEEIEDSTLVPIVSASRQERLVAAHKLPDLLANLRAAITREATRVEEAKAAIESFISSLDSEESSS